MKRVWWLVLLLSLVSASAWAQGDDDGGEDPPTDMAAPPGFMNVWGIVGSGTPKVVPVVSSWVCTYYQPVVNDPTLVSGARRVIPDGEPIEGADASLMLAHLTLAGASGANLGSSTGRWMSTLASPPGGGATGMGWFQAFADPSVFVQSSAWVLQDGGGMPFRWNGSATATERYNAETGMYCRDIEYIGNVIEIWADSRYGANQTTGAEQMSWSASGEPYLAWRLELVEGYGFDSGPSDTDPYTSLIWEFLVEQWPDVETIAGNAGAIAEDTYVMRGSLTLIAANLAALVEDILSPGGGSAFPPLEDPIGDTGYAPGYVNDYGGPLLADHEFEAPELTHEDSDVRPYWTFSVPSGLPVFGGKTFVLNFGDGHFDTFHSHVRPALHFFILAMATLWGMGRVWAELRKH